MKFIQPRKRFLSFFPPRTSGDTEERLNAARTNWRQYQDTQPSRLDRAWEDRVLFALQYRSIEEPDIPNWLAQRFQTVALANIGIILCAAFLLWHAGDPGSAFAEYTQWTLTAYEVFF